MFKNHVEFRKSLLIVVLLLLLSTVFSVRLIDPISKQLSPTESNYVGRVAVGNTIELIFSKELTDKYEDIKMVTALPSGFSYSVKNELESIKLFISVPLNASGDYPISVSLIGPNKTDKVSLYFTVVEDNEASRERKESYLVVSPAEVYEQKVLVDGRAEYKLFFKNNTDGDATFNVSINLPSNWVSNNSFETTSSQIVVSVPKQSSLEQSVYVYPRLEGRKEFVVTVSYENTKTDLGFVVDASPTLKSKLEAVFYGVPFYSFSLMPSYFAGGLFSFFLN